MHEADDGTNTEFAEAREARVSPRPIGVFETVGRGALPQNWITDRAYAEAGEEV
jgi:hypothetical protein